MVNIDRSQPLTLTDSLGRVFTAVNNSTNIFSEVDRPEPYVGQYDIQTLVPNLNIGIPLQLTLPTTNNQLINLLISPSVVEQWKTVANHG